MQRFAFAVAIMTVAAALSGGLGLPSDTSAQDRPDIAETRTVALDEGWNLAGWTGPDTPLADAILDIVTVIVAAAAFDTGQEAFRTWNATAPPFLNSLDTLRQGQAVWVLVTAPISWVQPVVADPGPLALLSGFNLLTWSGPSGLDPVEAFAGIDAALDVAFAFDKPAETFTSFGPARPAFLNDLAPLLYGDGFWVRLDAAATWTQPTSSPPAQVTSADTSATLAIPRGALPQGVDPAELTISDGRDGPVPILEGGDPPLIALQLEPSGLTFPAPVLLSVLVALGAGEMPIPVLLSRERGVEFVPGATIDSDPDELGRVIVTFPLDHFSVTALYKGAPAMFEVAAVAAGEVPVGAEFDAAAVFGRNAFEFKVTITKPGDFLLSNPGSPASEVDPDAPERGAVKQIVTIRDSVDAGTWTIDTGRFTVQSGSLSFDPFSSLQRSARIPRRLLTLDQQWMCEEPGAFSLRVQGKGRNPTTLRAISFAKDGSIQADKTFRHRAVQALPVALIKGTCVAPPGSMAFNSDSGQFSEMILIGTPMEILVADPTTPLTDPGRFPITVEVRVNGVLQRTVMIDGDPADACANANVCSTHLDAIEAEPGDTVVITATDAKGNVVAHQSLTVS